MFSGDKSDKSLRWDFPGDVSSLISDNSWKQSRRGLQMMQMWPRACRLAILLSQQLYILNLEECTLPLPLYTYIHADFNVLSSQNILSNMTNCVGMGWLRMTKLISLQMKPNTQRASDRLFQYSQVTLTRFFWMKDLACFVEKYYIYFVTINTFLYYVGKTRYQVYKNTQEIMLRLRTCVTVSHGP